MNADSQPIKTPHIVLTHGRSGSNFVVNTLNQHPEICNFGEIFGDWTPTGKWYRRLRRSNPDWAAYADRFLESGLLFRSAQLANVVQRTLGGRPRNYKPYGQVKTVGFKDFAFHFERLGLLDYLRERPQLRVICLSRDNDFERYVSLKRMKLTGQAVARDGGQRTVNLHIDTDDMLHTLREIQHEKAVEAEITQGLVNPIMHIAYERYFADEDTQQSINRAMFGFLGVSDFTARGEHKKVITAHPSEFIENWQEVQDVLAVNQFDHFLSSL